MGRNASHAVAAGKHRANGKSSDVISLKKREAKKIPALPAPCGAAKNNVNVKLQQLRNRIVYKKSSNVVLIGIQVLMFLVILNYYVDIAEAASEQVTWYTQDDSAHRRESRRMFGGYRITPRFCTPTLKNSIDKRKGPTICMFNHECSQRNGEVVGACMDGFLFGACCRIPGTSGIIKDSVESGVVTLVDKNHMKTPESSDDFELIPGGGVKLPQITNSISEKTNVYMIKNVESTYGYSTPSVRISTPEYISSKNPYYDDNKFVEVSSHHVENPSTLSVSISHLPSSTEKLDHDLTSSGLAQIANMLQGTPTKSDIVTMISSSNSDSNVFSHSTISHDKPDTILLNKNGSEAHEIFRPGDFGAQSVQVSTMQTKPSMVTNMYTSRSPTSTVPSVVTHKPMYQKPIFRPKPIKPSSSSQDKFVLVPTVMKPDAQETPPSGTSSAIASIETIMNMLNDSHPSTIANDDLTTSVAASTTEAYRPENRITTVEMAQSTVSPLAYSSGYPIIYDEYDYISTIRPTTGHYITTSVNKYTTFNPPSTSYVSSSTATRRPGYTGATNSFSGSTNSYSGSTNRYPDKYSSTSVFYTKKPVNADKNKLDKLPSIENNLVSSTLSYDEYWGSNPYTSPVLNKKPPSTSYVYSPTPSKRPISNVPNIIGPNYDISSNNLDSFSSVTPTVIVLSSPDSHDYAQTQNPIKIPDRQPVEAKPDNQENFVQIPLKPHKKPPNLITINNFITSNNMIHLGQQNQGKPTSEKPSPTVLITPKPNIATTTYKPNAYSPIPVRPAVSVLDNPDRYPSSSKPTYKPTKKPTTYVISSTITKKPTTAKPTTNTPAWTTAQSIIIPTTAAYIQTTLKNDLLTSPDDFINFPPVRNPNLNATGSSSGFYNNSVSLGIDDIVLQEVEFTTPSFLQEDEDLNLKMNLFVNKIVGSLQGTFQELHDIVILDKTPNTTITQQNNKIKPGDNASSVKPSKKPSATTKRPPTSKKPTRAATTTTTTTTKKPVVTKKPVRTTTAKTTTTTTAATVATTKKPVRAPATTKKPRPTKPKTTTSAPITETESQETLEPIFTTETASGDYKHLCGVRPMVKSGRIVGGKGATFGEWPWQVLVRESTWLGLFTKNKCGGVLISNRYVTTAAHCQPGFLASLVAVFGEFDISGELEGKRSVSKNVRRVIVHRQYDAATFENDLALLELDSPVHYDTHIVPICMPSDEADFTGRFATVTGWGRLKYGGGVPSVLQEVQVPIMENSVCQEMFNTAGHTKVILNSFLCAGYANGQKDSCEGDSGGPLVLQRADGRWELAGTVSHGIKCAAPYLPGVYMRTTYYKPWLRSITGVH